MIKALIDLLRVRQYYKNLLIFLPIIFSKLFFNVNDLLLTLLGFIALCFVSSSNYVLNDIIDVKKDRLHPDKRTRPIAAGKIKIWQGVVIAIVLLIGALVIGVFLSPLFISCLLFLFLFTLLYSLVLKKEVFVDIIAISVLLVVRAMSGAFIIQVGISPWLIFCIFFLALFLAVGKRHADVKFLGKSAEKTRPVLRYYTLEINNALMIISTTALVLSYSLYAFFSQYKSLVYTIPFALYVIFRYFYLIYSGDTIARNPERALIDPRIIIGVILWVIVSFLIIYL